MKNILVVLLVFTVLTAQGREKYIDGEGKFHVQEGDSFKLTSAQLKYAAFKDIITQALNANNFNAEHFWFKYNEKFNESFKSIDTKMRDNFAKKENPSNEQLDQFYKALRIRRLTAKAKFGRLGKVIKSYSEKKRGASETNPKIKYLIISAAVDERILNRLYLKMTEEKEKTLEKIYITSKIELQDAIWQDLGVEQEPDFTSVLMNHWQEWLKKHLKRFEGEFHIADENIEKGIRTYISAPTTFDNTAIETNKQSYTSSQLTNNLWLHLHIAIRKVSDNMKLQERQFKITGGFILTNLSDKKIVHHGDFALKKEKYSTQDQVKLSSAIANAVWKMPLEGFKAIPKKLSLLPRSIGRVKLEVHDIPNIDEFIKFTKVLAKRGLSKQFRPSIISYSGTRGMVQLEYRSSFNDMIHTLQSLDDTLTGGNRSISLVSREKPFFFALKEVKSSLRIEKGSNP